MKELATLIPSSKLDKSIFYIIDNAENHIMLASPYCDFVQWEKLTSAIKNAVDRNVETVLYVRDLKNCFENESIKFCIEIGVHIYVVPNLHAKIYMNEKEAVITSFNLSYKSALYSKEVGCFLTSKRILEKLHEQHFDLYEVTGRCISFRIKVVSDVEELSTYFPYFVKY